MPGFRKGRVPSSILQTRFAEYIKSETLQNLVPSAYEKALDSEGLVPLDNPEISPRLEQLELEEGQPLLFYATVAIQPDLSIPKYEELEVEKNTCECASG